MRTRHYTGASGFIYAYFDIYWIAVAIAAARVGWGDCVRVDARCAGGDIGGPIPNQAGRKIGVRKTRRLTT